MSSDMEIPEGLPDKEQLMKAIETAQAAQRASSTAADLKAKASAMTDPAQREKMLQDAYNKEVEANGLSKMAKRMQSGPWQGLGFGGGIGAATGIGLGGLLGTVLSGVLAVPTTGLGMLVGTGVGAIHGPWIKLGGKEQKFEDADPEEIVGELERERGGGGGEEMEKGVVDSAADIQAQQEVQRRKPKKLEIRSKREAAEGQGGSQETGVTGGVADESKPGGGGVQQKVTSGFGVADESKPRRKPKKIEVRSGKAAGNASSKA